MTSFSWLVFGILFRLGEFSTGTSLRLNCPPRKTPGELPMQDSQKWKSSAPPALFSP